MKYCEQCGVQLIDSAVFCQKCGARQKTIVSAPVEPAANAAEMTKQKPKRKKKLLAIIIAAAAVVLAAVIVIVGLLIIPKSFAKNVEYSKGSSERDSRFNLTFEQFLNKSGKAAEDHYDYYKNIAMQQIDYDTSGYKADFFEYMIGAYSGKEFKEKVCDKNNWSKDENGDYIYTFSVTSSSGDQSLKMSEVTVYMDDNKSDKITGILILFGNEEKEITQLQKTAVEFISFVFTEAVTGANQETNVICPLLAFHNSIEIYVYNEVKFQTTPTMETVNMVTIDALSEQAKNEGNLSKQEEMGIVTWLTDDDIDKAKAQLLSAQEQTKTIPTKTQQSTTQAVTHKSNDNTSESSNDTNLDYTVGDFGDFYVYVPNNWVYEVENGGISFYEAYNHSHDETGSTGYLCDIKGVSPENISDISQNSEYLGSSGTIEYYVEFPMGIGMIEDKTASDKMQIAHSQVEDFLDSIVFK